MKAGFTGTREGMTGPQREAFFGWLEQQNYLTEFHHGCCVGADAQAVADVSLRADVCIVAHPGDLGAMTDADSLAASRVAHKPKANLDRNRDIVDACDVLIAAPKGPEELRSGTWSTVRYARRRAKHHTLRIVIVRPDGTTEETP